MSDHQLQYSLHAATAAPSLPNEIFLHILSCILEWEERPAAFTFRQLCLVCRQCAAMAQPLLFACTGVEFNLGMDSLATMEDAEGHALVLAETLKSRRDIATKIRRFSIRDGSSAQTSLPPPQSLVSITRSLRQLETICLSGIAFTGSLYKILFQIPSLRRCLIRSPRMPVADYSLGSGGLPSHEEVAQLGIQELLLDNINQGLPVGFPNALVRLAWGPNLRVLRITDWPIMQIFCYNSPWPTLPTFANISILHLPPLTQRDTPSITFLGLFPNLLELAFDPVPPGVPSMYGVGAIPSTIIPRLHTFCGPIEVGRLLVPGRPIKNLHLHLQHKGPNFAGARLSIATLQPFTLSTVGVERVVIENPSWNNDTLLAVAACFPYAVHLELIDIVGDDMSWINVKRAADFSRFFHLRSLVMRGQFTGVRESADDAGAERSMLYAISAVRNSLQEASFACGSNWKRKFFGSWARSAVAEPVGFQGPTLTTYPWSTAY